MLDSELALDPVELLDKLLAEDSELAVEVDESELAELRDDVELALLSLDAELADDAELTLLAELADEKDDADETLDAELCSSATARITGLLQKRLCGRL